MLIELKTRKKDLWTFDDARVLLEHWMRDTPGLAQPDLIVLHAVFF